MTGEYEGVHFVRVTVVSRKQDKRSFQIMSDSICSQDGRNYMDKSHGF